MTAPPTNAPPRRRNHRRDVRDRSSSTSVGSVTCVLRSNAATYGTTQQCPAYPKGASPASIHPNDQPDVLQQRRAAWTAVMMLVLSATGAQVALVIVILRARRPLAENCC